MSGHHILLVDDDRNVLEVLGLLFSGEGYRMTTATNGEDALKMLEKIVPDLILADYQMSPINGIEFLKRARTVCPDAVHILLTAYGDLDVAMTAINEVNIYRFLLKPWSRDSLLVTIRKALEHHDQVVYHRVSTASLESVIENSVREMEHLSGLL